MNTIVRVRVDAELKRQTEAILGGLPLSAAVRQLMLHIVRDGRLPFGEIIETVENDLVTAEMRHCAATRSRNYFGLSGMRAAVSLLYHRSASSREVNAAARALGSRQEYYLNLLHQAIEWGHEVWTWTDPARGGRVYQLVYNPDHRGPGGVAPPADWRELNVLKVPPGIPRERYLPYRSS
jgi:antitoxin component of RelBE/YafQ-DinJ toxin-antitoxin module